MQSLGSVLASCIYQPHDCDVERVNFVHFLDFPHPALTVPAHRIVHVAATAKRYGGVLKALLDVVRITRTGRITNAARQFFYVCQVPALGVV